MSSQSIATISRVLTGLDTAETATDFDTVPRDWNTPTHSLGGPERGLLIRRDISSNHISIIADLRAVKATILPTRLMARWLRPFAKLIEPKTKIDGVSLYGIRFSIDTCSNLPNTRTVLLDLVVPSNEAKAAVEMLEAHGISASYNGGISRRFRGNKSFDTLGADAEIKELPVITIGYYGPGYRSLERLKEDAYLLEKAGVIKSATALVQMIGVLNDAIVHPEILEAPALPEVMVARKLLPGTKP